MRLFVFTPIVFHIYTPPAVLLHPTFISISISTYHYPPSIIDIKNICAVDGKSYCAIDGTSSLRVTGTSFCDRQDIRLS